MRVQCPNCHFDLQSINIKDQFIRGLQNKLIQTDILAKASQLKTLEDVIKHSEAFETAQRDQIQLQGSSEVMAARMSDYQKKKKEPNLPKPQTTRPGIGCGSHLHGQPGSNDLPGEKLLELQNPKSFCKCVSTTKSK